MLRDKGLLREKGWGGSFNFHLGVVGASYFLPKGSEYHHSSYMEPAVRMFY